MTLLNVETVEKYLEAQHYQLWSVWATKTDPRQRREAAEWFIKELNGIIRWADEQSSETKQEIHNYD